ncbi:MAG: SH3 domain-containing protein, partial [Novosphingobium sp.]
MTVEATPLSTDLPGGQLVLTRPADRSDKPHLPVRGDLAHIGLAGKYFVPHYAVPMPHGVKADSVLRASGRPEADELRALAKG